MVGVCVWDFLTQVLFPYFSNHIFYDKNNFLMVFFPISRLSSAARLISICTIIRPFKRHLELFNLMLLHQNSVTNVFKFHLTFWCLSVIGYQFLFFLNAIPSVRLFRWGTKQPTKSDLELQVNRLHNLKSNCCAIMFWEDDPFDYFKSNISKIFVYSILDRVWFWLSIKSRNWSMRPPISKIV